MRREITTVKSGSSDVTVGIKLEREVNIYMAYQNDNTNFTPRPKIDISSLGITCAECGTPINELPFEPSKREDGTYGRLFCYDCNKQRRRDSGPRGGGGGFGGGNRGGGGGFGGGRNDRRF